MLLESAGDGDPAADARRPDPRPAPATARPPSRRTLWWLLAAAAVPWAVAALLVLRATR